MVLQIDPEDMGNSNGSMFKPPLGDSTMQPPGTRRETGHREQGLARFEKHARELTLLDRAKRDFP
jgi:hypothetical protein